TIWLARALPPEGKVVTLEFNEKHAAVARSNFRRAGLDAQIELRQGDAMAELPKLATEGRRPFDFVFIDANKDRIPEYFEWVLKLARRGSVIVVDNVIRNGAVADAQSTDPSVQGVRRFNALAGRDRRVEGATLQTVGSKGYDGFAVLIVNGA